MGERERKRRNSHPYSGVMHLLAPWEHVLHLWPRLLPTAVEKLVILLPDLYIKIWGN